MAVERSRVVAEARTEPDLPRPTEAGLGLAAEEALRLATQDPAAARRLAADTLGPARFRRDWAVVSVAERALGVAAMTSSNLPEALPHLRASVAAGKRAGCTRRVGEARMSLASALVLSGRCAPALREIEAAVVLLEGASAARARVQRAAISQELGHFEEALRDLRHALPVLRRAGDGQWATNALSNRSLIHVARRAFAAAEADLLEAAALCRRDGLGLPGAYAEQNLGCLRAQQGDVPGALRHFDEAEGRYHRYGVEEGALLLDRAELLLSVRLVEEARVSAERAVAAYEQHRREVHVPEARLLLSTVALVQGDPAAAWAAADAAERGFRRLRRRESVALARYARMQADLALRPAAVLPARARRCAAELEAAGWIVPALEARVLAGRLALDRGRRADARRDLSRASRARRAGPADARARAWLAEGLLRRAEGRRQDARAALTAGLRAVEEHQATLGATELRAHVSLHRGALARSGLRMALEDGNPREVLRWAERGRASALLVRPVRPPEDAVLAAHLADLRATMAEIAEAREDGRGAATLVERQVRLERLVRDRSRVTEGGSRDPRGRLRPVRDLLEPLGDAALVEYVTLDHDVQAVTVAGGRARLHALGRLEPVRDALEQLSFALHRRAHPRTRPASRGAATAVARRASRTLDDLLLRPLLPAVADRPLVVAPIPPLASLPWSTLPSCTGRPVSVTPSAALWHQAADGSSGRPAAVGTVVVAGPGLPGADGEAATIAALYPGALLLRGIAATASAVSAAVSGAQLLHLAAHGNVRSDNPLFSSLLLADGPFTVYDLERVPWLPRSVVLAACDTGRSQVVAGAEVLGFGATLLAGGTSTLVAPVIAVPDAETAPLMQAYHQNRGTGASPAEALAAAQVAVGADDELGQAAAAGFVCLGAG